jgi:hypothetical protein
MYGDIARTSAAREASIRRTRAHFRLTLQSPPDLKPGARMHRRTFLVRAGGLTISVASGLGIARAAHSAADRVGMGTVIFRNRFEQTKPKAVTELRNPSLEKPYLMELRARVETAEAALINIQVDGAYDLASTNDEERQRSLETVRKWIDAAALLRSRAVRINPGRAGGSVEKSIASLKEVNRYCVSKRLPLLTENHFGLEMDPAVHLKIREAAGPKNIYTLPDFVSAKAVDFDERGTHISYDFDRCVQLCERAEFKGIYLVEQWSRRDQDLDYEKIADWMLQRVRMNLRRS